MSVESSFAVGAFFVTSGGGGGGARNSSKVPKRLDFGCLREMALVADDVVGSAHGRGLVGQRRYGSVSATEGDSPPCSSRL